MANEQVYLPMIGVDMLHIAKVTADTKTEYTAETPSAIPGLTEAGFNVNAQRGTLYADNGPFATAIGNGEFSAAVACADITSALKSTIYGYAYNASTGELLGGEIKSPDIAIQYRIQKSNGAFRYVTLYKMKAKPGEEKYKTKGGSINFDTNGFSLVGSMRIKDGKLFRILDDDDPNLPAGVTPQIIESKWFTDVNWVIAAT